MLEICKINSFFCISVFSSGIIPKGELLEYLRGAPLEIQVHDRDRRPEDIKQKPTLFGEDTEDDKISNVGMVASKYSFAKF